MPGYPTFLDIRYSFTPLALKQGAVSGGYRLPLPVSSGPRQELRMSTEPALWAVRSTRL